MAASLKFIFVPDTEFDAKLKINVDLTVAMPCHGECHFAELDRTYKPIH
jgi:hypothetical protein